MIVLFVYNVFSQQACFCGVTLPLGPPNNDLLTCVNFLHSLVRYLHPTDNELKSLAGKGSMTSKGRRRKSTELRFVIVHNLFLD